MVDAFDRLLILAVCWTYITYGLRRQPGTWPSSTFATFLFMNTQDALESIDPSSMLEAYPNLGHDQALHLPAFSLWTHRTLSTLPILAVCWTYITYEPSVFPSSSLRVAHVASISVWVFVRVGEGFFLNRSEDWGEKKTREEGRRGRVSSFFSSPLPLLPFGLLLYTTYAQHESAIAGKKWMQCFFWFFFM